MKGPTKLAAAVTAAGLTLALTACSSGTDEADDEPLASAGAADVSGEVTFWHAYSADSPEVATLQDTIIPGFEALHPDVTVKEVAVPYDDLHQKLVTAVAGDQLPDLVRADIAWVPELADLGVLVPLDTQMPDFQELADQTYPGALATNKWQDHYYGLPLDTNTRVLMYNQEALDAAGVAEVPATMDDLWAAGPALKAAGSFAFADNGAGGWNVLPFIWSEGGDITDADYTTATGYMNGAETVAAVQQLVDMYADGFTPDIVMGGEGGLSTSDGLASGDYATIFDGPWMYPIFASQYPDFELRTAPIPAGEAGSISVVGGENVILTQSSDNKDAAAEFMRYLLSQEAQLAMAEVGQMPVLADLGDQLTEVNEYYGVFAEQLVTARPRPVTPAWTQIDTLLQDAIRSAMRGETTVQEALDQAAAESDTLLATYAGQE